MHSLAICQSIRHNGTTRRQLPKMTPSDPAQHRLVCRIEIARNQRNPVACAVVPDEIPEKPENGTYQVDDEDAEYDRLERLAIQTEDAFDTRAEQETVDDGHEFLVAAGTRGMATGAKANGQQRARRRTDSNGH